MAANALSATRTIVRSGSQRCPQFSVQDFSTSRFCQSASISSPLLNAAIRPGRSSASIGCSWLAPVGHVYLDGASTEQFIHQLAGHRAQLTEGVTPDIEHGSRLEAVIDPRWRVPSAPAKPIATLTLPE